MTQGHFVLPFSPLEISFDGLNGAADDTRRRNQRFRMFGDATLKSESLDHLSQTATQILKAIERYSVPSRMKSSQLGFIVR